jgi:hypothetical protein
MAECLYKEDAECIKTPVDNICANCRIRLIATDLQFASIDYKESIGFVMIEKSCHTCEYGIYENQEQSIRAAVLTCIKVVKAKHNGEISNPKRCVCNLWEQNDIYRWMDDNGGN